MKRVVIYFNNHEAGGSNNKARIREVQEQLHDYEAWVAGTQPLLLPDYCDVVLVEIEHVDETPTIAGDTCDTCNLPKPAACRGCGANEDNSDA